MWVDIERPWTVLVGMVMALCTACGTGTEGDAGAQGGDAGLTYDAGEPDADAGSLTVDAGPLDACEERQAQWCRQGCIGTIGIDRDCPELDCEC